MIRALALALAACGPVVAPVEPTPAETIARQAVTAALRASLIEVCRATLPELDAHPLARIAWAMACAPYTQPAAGVSLPLPQPPASPSEVP